ncbi:ER membrane protein complex subunit 8-like [Lethenteron reissneri]|uniref:ER membrane protein complex subunit 8-like n=1 Tax=Lethenteron reissneri TaxID=7753 RepID=UPI002AB5EE1B|nr:ER membrane protein complex subunit 8-like [Lethenteron reissneri]
MADVELTLTVLAYAKMQLHAARYPHCPVSGVLLAARRADEHRTDEKMDREERDEGDVAAAEQGDREAAGGGHRHHNGGENGPSRAVLLCDAVPLFHAALSLAPMMEVALSLIDAWCKEQGLAIAGYYQANINVNDSRPNVVAHKVADRILDNFRDATLVMLDNKRMSLEHQEPAICVYESQGSAQWRRKDLNQVLLEREALPITGSLLGSGEHSRLVDFDAHLADIRQDWRNPEVARSIQLLC